MTDNEKNSFMSFREYMIVHYGDTLNDLSDEEMEQLKGSFIGAGYDLALAVHDLKYELAQTFPFNLYVKVFNFVVKILDGVCK